MPAGLNEIFPEVHEKDRPSARQWNTLTAAVMRQSQPNRGRMRTLSNGAGVFTVPEPEDGLLFYNGDATTIPAYGVVLDNGVQAAGGPDFAPKMKRPDTFGCQENFFINGPNSVEATSWGFSQFGYGNEYIAAYNNADGSPLPGEEWGPFSGDYLLRAGGGGFVIIGIYDSTNHWAIVRSSPMMSFRGQVTADVPALSTATVNVWARKGGVLTNLGQTMTGVYNGSSCTILSTNSSPTGTYVICKFDRSDPSNPWWFDIFYAK